MSTKEKKSDRRIEFEIIPERLRELKFIMSVCDIRTRKSLVDNAFTLFEWAIAIKTSGQDIAAYNKHTDHVEVVRFPVLDIAAIRAERKFENDRHAKEQHIQFLKSAVERHASDNSLANEKIELAIFGEESVELEGAPLRIQFNIMPERLLELDKIMEACDIKTRKDLFDNAVTLFEWAVESKYRGRDVVAYSDEDDHVEIVRFPVLETAAIRGRAMQHPGKENLGEMKQKLGINAVRSAMMTKN